MPRKTSYSSTLCLRFQPMPFFSRKKYRFLGVDIFDEGKYLHSFGMSVGDRFAFSINSNQNARKIIENIMNQSRLIFRYRMIDKHAIIESFKNFYTQNDVVKTIDPNTMISYKYSKTKVDDLGIGGTRVLYKHDYLTNKTTESTEDKKIHSMEEIESYKNHYGIDLVEEKEKYQIEIKAPYITNEATANRLRDYIFEMTKHQHLLVNFKIQLTISQIVTVEPYPRLYGFIDSPFSNTNNAPSTTSRTYKKSLTTSAVPQTTNGSSPLNTLLISAGIT